MILKNTPPNLNISTKLEQISRFEYPRWLMRIPRFIYIFYAINYFFQLRKWHVSVLIKKVIKSSAKRGTWLENGCGEGQYLVPISRKFRFWKCVGMDIKESNITFLRKLIPEVQLIHDNIEFSKYDEKADLITCIGVLQYVGNDHIALTNMAKLLKDNGKCILYVPVNGQIHSALYSHLLDKNEHYEKVNERQRIYTVPELIKKVNDGGFNCETSISTYGICGRLSHELTQSLMILITTSQWLVKILSIFTLLFISPLIILLMTIDYNLKHSYGNGIVMILTKKAV